MHRMWCGAGANVARPNPNLSMWRLIDRKKTGFGGTLGSCTDPQMEEIGKPGCSIGRMRSTFVLRFCCHEVSLFLQAHAETPRGCANGVQLLPFSSLLRHLQSVNGVFPRFIPSVYRDARGVWPAREIDQQGLCSADSIFKGAINSAITDSTPCCHHNFVSFRLFSLCAVPFRMIQK